MINYVNNMFTKLVVDDLQYVRLSVYDILLVQSYALIL